MSTTVDRLPESGQPPSPAEVVRVSVPQRSFRSELRAIKIVWRRELIRYRSDRLRMVTTLVQPLLFLFVLGSGLQQLSAASTHGVNLKTFIYPGILCIAVMFTAMFSAASIVWDREFGFLREMMVAPVRRSSIVIGKCLGGATVASIQGVIVLALAGLVGVPYDAAADHRRVLPAAAAGVCDHSLRGDDRGADQADAVVHGRHADDRDADVLHLRRPVPGRRTARCWLTILNRIDPLTYAVDPMRHLVFSHLSLSPAAQKRAGSGRHLVWLARAGSAGGRHGRDPGLDHAGDRDLGVQRDRIGTSCSHLVNKGVRARCHAALAWQRRSFWSWS